MALQLRARMRLRHPSGDVPVDRERRSMLIASGDVMSADAPHAQEHSLEVQLPFLQRAARDFELLPLVAGAATPDHVAQCSRMSGATGRRLVLISSDLSHYHPYATAQQIDRETSTAILGKSSTLSGEQACGAVCINGLLHLAKATRGPCLQIMRLNSGDTAGDRRRVVGYGAFAVPGESGCLIRRIDTCCRWPISPFSRACARNVAFPVPTLSTTALDASRASFVTLRTEGRLRGCCGTLEPQGHSPKASGAMRGPRRSPIRALRLREEEYANSTCTSPY